MDYMFPRELFSSYYNCGPPDLVWRHLAGNWGSYDRLRCERGSGPRSSWKFTPKHQTRGESWRHTEPLPLPLLPPRKTFPCSSKPPDPMDFTEHMQNFYTDHCHDAFGSMGELLRENFNFKGSKHKKEGVNMWTVENYINTLDIKRCHKTYRSWSLDGYSALLSDAVHSVPPQLLGSLLYEELTEQRERVLFSEEATGGALAFIPSSQGDRGCLVFAGSKGLNQLNFHSVELLHHRGASSVLTTGNTEPFRVHLKCPIRQISSASLFDTSCVAVRLDRLCGVWKLGEGGDPRLLQVVNTTEVASCVSVSPHVLGEVQVASESGAVNLWTVGKRIQKVREEDTNLYFNAKSRWRWCDFSAHPRVMLYADRTGAELTDTRSSPVRGHTLFRISNTSECRSGERLVLSSYLGHVHPFHHLITTQFSAYIMDERFPCVPMLKWDHMMESPPLFCHVLPGSASSALTANGAGTTKLVLGSCRSQEITMLQYSGGRVDACSSCGPPQALLRPTDSLKLLPVQIPHRQEVTMNRLSSPAAGLTCVQKTRGDRCVCVLQLTEAADIFYQILEPEDQHTTRPTAAAPARETSEGPAPHPQAVASDSWSEEEMIGPTQAVGGFVAETPEREQPSDSEDSGTEARRRRRKLLGLEVVVNDEERAGSDEDCGTGEESRRLGESGLEVVVSDEEEGEAAAAAAAAEPAGGAEETVQRSAQASLSADALVTWKHWIQKLLKKSGEDKFRPRVQVSTIKPGRRLSLPSDAAADPSEAELVGRLRRDLRGCMSNRSLLLPSTVSDALGTPDFVPLPDAVDAAAWTDELSRRLTASWEGVEQWEAWWEDKLGLNKEAKVRALRRKRRREKEERRASGQRLALSGSFTSSISYQSNLDGFSDAGGWSSAASQGAWSDSEGLEPLSQVDADFGESRGPTPTATPTKSQPDALQTPSRAKPDNSLPVGQRSKPPADAAASTPQRSSAQSPLFQLQRALRSDQPRDALTTPGLSQSQSSQGRAGPSQASQAKKKKSRMGF